MQGSNQSVNSIKFISKMVVGYGAWRAADARAAIGSIETLLTMRVVRMLTFVRRDSNTPDPALKKSVMIRTNEVCSAALSSIGRPLAGSRQARCPDSTRRLP